jgi:rhamnosyltransferase
MKVSVLIPTKNGAEYLEECLNAVFRQKTVFVNEKGEKVPFDFEIVIIDSGSTDKTLEIINKFAFSQSSKGEKFPQIKFSQIPAEEFNHGTTRNLLASKAQGEYLVYICQDVIPVDENWLGNMIAPFEDDSEIAGIFGRQSPRKDCDPFQRKSLDEFMDSFGKELTVYQLKSDDKQKEFEENKHVFSFFSSANSAIRKSVWEKIPYRHVVALGEDQFWAKDILLAGYKKVYQPSANAYHSHNFGVWGQFKRWFDEFYHHRIVQNYIGVSSPYKIFPLALRLWFNDVKYIRRRNEYNFLQKIYWIIWIFFMDLARFLSEYLGARYDKLPGWLQRRFSMQYQLIHKR